MTKLDDIITEGLKRMDDAVERSIQRISPDSPVIETRRERVCKLCDRVNPYEHMAFCINLNCSGPLIVRQVYISDHKLI